MSPPVYILARKPNGTFSIESTEESLDRERPKSNWRDLFVDFTA